ncbi:MAG: SGNH/GDSL hydrolase family protein [Acidobacteriota bacterium]
MKKNLGIVAALAVTLLAALSLTGAALAQNTGNADFTRYVAVGDSLTAGFASSGLHADVQALSYPALIARQAGAPDFQQPLAGAPGIPPLLAIQSLGPGAPVIVPRAAQPGPPLNLGLPRPYNNMAVPGFTVTDVVTTRTGNGIIDLVLRGLGTQLELAAVQQPTFASVWIGNNDVLGAATSGIVIDGVTLTPAAQFESDYRQILGTLAAVGANMVVATIPSVTSIPFVTTLPPVVVDPATSQPVILNGAPVPLIGPSGPLGPGDRVLLTASGFLAQGFGIPAQLGGNGQPLPNEAVLDADEVATIEARLAQYNDAIRRAATDFGAALVPVNSIFSDIARNGYDAGGGIVYTTDFLTGGIFSYDGVHPTPFGYALVANEFIAAINASYGASIPAVDLFPFIFGAEANAGATIPSASSLTGAVFSQAAATQLFTALRITGESRQIDNRPRRPRRPRRPVGGDSPGDGDLNPVDPRGEVDFHPRGPGRIRP